MKNVRLLRYALVALWTVHRDTLVVGENTTTGISQNLIEHSFALVHIDRCCRQQVIIPKRVT